MILGFTLTDMAKFMLSMLACVTWQGHISAVHACGEIRIYDAKPMHVIAWQLKEG